MNEQRRDIVDRIAEAERARAEAWAELVSSPRAPEAVDGGELVEGYDDLPAYLTPAKVGAHVGKSKSWVLQNIAMFDARRDDNGYYLIPKRAVLRYLQTRTEKVEP